MLLHPYYKLSIIIVVHPIILYLHLYFDFLKLDNTLIFR